MMRVVFLGKSIEAMDEIQRRGHKIVLAVVPPQLGAYARLHGIPSESNDGLYHHLARHCPPEDGFQLQDIDLVVSFLFWLRIRPPLIRLPRVGCVNFHPAPLPEYRGVGGCNMAIMLGRTSWGVSAHHVDEDFDTGDIIAVRRWDIDSGRETAQSLHRRSIEELLRLLGSVLDVAEQGPLPRTPQGAGCYYSRYAVDTYRAIRPDDDGEMIDRRIRAFWFPPWPGATVQVNGETCTVINERILQELAR